MNIPIYRIDLSLPPRERYTQLATDFGPRMRTLTPLFDEVLSSIIPYEFFCKIISFFAKIFLRKVYNKEETQELRGISSISGVDLYLLVALNVLLDSLLGCTSGGIMTRPGSGQDKALRMMHFRTLDWGMDGLRDLIVELEFVRSNGKDPDKVIGRCITYAGFTGILTGVR
jgi:beta subunit of N-acylethanolamine-hydrolyzing acid amidase